jgi:uncharacterized protein (TIGR03085 family)
MGLPIDERERLQLCDLMQELGPDAPTLCEGWTTADLTAHLLIREHFRRWTDSRMAAEKAKGFPSQLARLRSGAPLIPWRLPGIRTVSNGLEYFIHHEDVRRANGLTPRNDVADVQDLSWRMSSFIGRRLARSIRPNALELASTDGRHRTFGSGSTVVLSGPPNEIILYLSGRRSAADVAISGSGEAIAALERAQTKL